MVFAGQELIDLYVSLDGKKFIHVLGRQLLMLGALQRVDGYAVQSCQFEVSVELPPFISSTERREMAQFVV